MLALMRCLSLCLFPLVVAAAAAEDATFKVEANRSQIYLGESFLLQITVSGLSQPVAPGLSQIKNCGIKPLGSRDISNYSITIINGRMVKEGFSGRIFSYELTPTIAGAFQAGPVTLAADGRQFKDPGPIIAVTDIEKQNLVNLAITVSRTTVLLDEAFEVTLTLMIKRLQGTYADAEPLLIDNPPVLSIPFLNGGDIPGLTGPDVRRMLQERIVRQRNQPGIAINDYTFSPDPFDFDSLLNLQGFFDRPRKAKFALPQRVVQQDGTNYVEYTLTLSYSPKEEGNYVFGPAVFKGAVPVAVDEQGRASAQNVFAVGAAQTVRVVPPPEEGRPPSFIGTLGTNLQVKADLDPRAGNVGDPIKLTLTVSGPVRLDKIVPPKLSLQTNIIQNFTVYDNTVQTLKPDNQRQYIYTLRPTRPGTFDLPPIELAYYDTQTRAYKIVATRPIPLQIKQGREITASQIISDTNRPAEKLPEENLLEKAPLPIMTAPAGAASGSLTGPHWLLGIAALGPLGYVLTAAFQTMIRRRPRRRLLARRRQALARARARLGKARKQKEPGRAASEICAAIRQYLADRLDATAAGITPADAFNLLRETGINPPVGDELRGLFERYFNTGYAEQDRSHDFREDSRQIESLISTIDDALKSRTPT